MRTILSNSIVFSPEQSKTNCKVPFIVPEKTYGLLFKCCYTPKNVEDPVLAEREIRRAIDKYIPEKLKRGPILWQDYLPLMNFVTLSLDRDGEYIGCAHRHAPLQNHLISAQYSSPGFYVQPDLIGAWNAVLNVHAIVSPEVQYQLDICIVDTKEAFDDLLQTL